MVIVDTTEIEKKIAKGANKEFLVGKVMGYVAKKAFTPAELAVLGTAMLTSDNFKNFQEFMKNYEERVKREVDAFLQKASLVNIKNLLALSALAISFEEIQNDFAGGVRLGFEVAKVEEFKTRKINEKLFEALGEFFRKVINGDYPELQSDLGITLLDKGLEELSVEELEKPFSEEEQEKINAFATLLLDVLNNKNARKELNRALEIPNNRKLLAKMFVLFGVSDACRKYVLLHPEVGDDLKVRKYRNLKMN